VVPVDPIASEEVVSDVELEVGNVNIDTNSITSEEVVSDVEIFSAQFIDADSIASEELVSSVEIELSGVTIQTDSILSDESVSNITFEFGAIILDVDPIASEEVVANVDIFSAQSVDTNSITSEEVVPSVEIELSGTALLVGSVSSAESVSNVNFEFGAIVVDVDSVSSGESVSPVRVLRGGTGVPPIPTLIDKEDNYERIRTQIAAILATETASQQEIAIAESKDPNLWKLRVYEERSNPWEAFLNEDSDRSPIINVWFDVSTFDGQVGSVVNNQKCVGTFNIDCYGYGVSAQDGDGHIPGDRAAALESHRAIKLVRNILMAWQYTYLGLRGLVWKRWPQSITSFQPQQGSDTVQQISASRLALQVTFSEFAPQYDGDTLDEVFIDVLRAEDGQILVEANYT